MRQHVDISKGHKLRLPTGGLTLVQISSKDLPLGKFLLHYLFKFLFLKSPFIDAISKKECLRETCLLPLFIRPDNHTDETLQLLGVSSKPNMMFRNSAFKKCKAAVDSGLDIVGFERYIDMLVEHSAR